MTHKIEEGLVLNGDHVELAKYEKIICKYCGSDDVVRYGVRDGIQNYICKACGRKFTAKDSPEGMQTPAAQIASALMMFYDGLSLSDIARNLDQTYHNPVNPSTVYRWLIKYTIKALNTLEVWTPKVSETWVVDETVVKVGGSNWWFWDVIDDGTRYLLASHLSKTRSMNDVVTVMSRALEKAGKPPRFILSDGLGVYPDGIERVFGADSKHIKTMGFTEAINTNLIERFHGTLKERVKVLRGFKTWDTAELILSGFLVNYNFFRPHMTLNNKTPAEIAGIKSHLRTWNDVVRA